MERNLTTAKRHGLLHLLASRRLWGGEKSNDSKKARSSSLILVFRVRENQRKPESRVFFTNSCVQGGRKPTTARKQGLLHVFLCSGLEKTNDSK